MRRHALLLLAAGCGRVGFGEGLADGPRAGDARSDATGDGSVDVADACTALFCDGFEDPSLAPWGSALDTGATATRDAMFGFRGASLHVVGPIGSTFAARYTDVFPATVPTDEWVRIYLYAPASTTLDAEPVELTNAAGDHQLVFSLYDIGVDIHAHGIAGDFSAVANHTAPRDTWSCYEFHVHVAAAGSVEMYRDGALVIAQPGIDTRPVAGDLSRVRVGMPSKDSDANVNLYIDEVAAGTSRIGCL